MKKTIDNYVIILGCFIDLIVMSILKYSQYLWYSNPIIKREGVFLKNEEAMFIYYKTLNVLLVFYVLGFIYLLIIIYKFKKNIYIDLKKNTLFLLVFLLVDAIFYFFNFRKMFRYSDALKFIIICLLTNLVVYIKYKKNNIKIE